LDDLLTPTPEVDFDEETGEITITMPEFPTFEVDEYEDDDGNNEDHTEPATKYIEPDKTKPKDTLSENNGEEETKKETNND